MVTTLIVTAGGRGDVAPYTGLARALADAGYHPAIATHTAFRGVVEEAGVEFRPLPENPMGFGVPAEEKLPGGAEGLGAAGDRIAEIADAVLAAARQGADLLLLNGATSPLGAVVAEGLGLPSMGVVVAPPGPTSAFPPAYVPASLGAWGNRAAWVVVDRMADTLLAAAPVRRLRAELGLPALSASVLRKRQDREGWPIQCGFSPAVVPPPRDWRPGIEAVGYWWPDAPAYWEPPAELTAFLAAGPPPVYVGFGTLAGREDHLATVVPEALRAAGVRAVIQAPWAGRVAGDDVLAIGEAPHDWLFPRMAAVVHAAGAGVVAAGLRAGVPAVPVPVDLDQPFWARRLVALGAAPDWVPAKKLTADRLAAAVRAAVREEPYRARAEELARQLAAEDGAARTVETVRRVVGAPATC